MILESWYLCWVLSCPSNIFHSFFYLRIQLVSTTQHFSTNNRICNTICRRLHVCNRTRISNGFYCIQMNLIFLVVVSNEASWTMTGHASVATDLNPLSCLLCRRSCRLQQSWIWLPLRFERQESNDGTTCCAVDVGSAGARRTRFRALDLDTRF